MNKYIIEGGHRLVGEIDVPTSKNAFLPIMAACLLTNKKVVLHKCPNYSDINNMINILKYLGVYVIREEDKLIIEAKKITRTDVPMELASKLRSSIFVLGPLIARKKKALVYYPGGCVIGARPIDIHILGLKTLGVKVVENNEFCNFKVNKLLGKDITLPFPSVGATENIIMASVLADGKTRIYNPAKEPEIVDLCNFLNYIGASITGAGTDTIEINGVNKLIGGEYTVIPDRIITGTYLLSGIITNGNILIKNCIPNHINDLLKKLENNTCNIVTNSDRIMVQGLGRFESLNFVETKPYPGFSTDLQPELMSLLSISRGTSYIKENIFETRFKHVKYLNKMGANIIIDGDTARIKGKTHLIGNEVIAEDIRGGAGLVLAGLVAKGTTIIDSINYIDRGYENLEKQLSTLGAKIKRI